MSSAFSLQILFALFAAVLAFVLFSRNETHLVSSSEPSIPRLSLPDNSSNYLALVGNKQQLGNQIWSLISGWSIAKKLGRKFYVSQNWHDPELLFFKLSDVHKIFPQFSTLYEILAPKDETLVAHGHFEGKMNICHFEDPLVHLERKERFLVLDSAYSQNARYFYDYRQEVRQIFSFSKQILREGKKFVKNSNLKTKKDVVCAHIRRRDFSNYNWQSEFNATLNLIRFVAENENQRTLVMFGDDQEFMKNVISTLQNEGIVNKNSFASTNSKGVDLFLSATSCSSVALSSQSSTFAFWLAFLSQNQESVYYLHDEFDPTNPYKPRFDEEFPLTWKDVKFENGRGTVV